MFKQKAKPITGQMLTDITRGLQHAASVTHQMTVQHHINLLEQFFDKDESGVLHAKHIEMAINDHHHMKVPLISLVKPNSLTLDEMKVSMAVRLDENTEKSWTDNIHHHQETRSAFKVTLSGNRATKNPGDLIQIDLTFKATEAPEGLERLVDEYTRLVQPHENGEHNDKNSVSG